VYLPLLAVNRLLVDALWSGPRSPDLGEDVGAEAVDGGRSRTSAEVPAHIEFFGQKLCGTGTLDEGMRAERRVERREWERRLLLLYVHVFGGGD